MRSCRVLEVFLFPFLLVLGRLSFSLPLRKQNGVDKHGVLVGSRKSQDSDQMTRIGDFSKIMPRDRNAGVFQ